GLADARSAMRSVVAYEDVVDRKRT
ncbi:MAG: hypothetical protein ACI9LT_002040, partial [Pseudoalteromonas distincta]